MGRGCVLGGYYALVHIYALIFPESGDSIEYYILRNPESGIDHYIYYGGRRCLRYVS